MGLWYIDNATAHASNEDHAALSLALHQVLGDIDGEEISTIDINGPQLAHAVDWVVDGVVVLGETCAGDQIVDLAVLFDDFLNARLYRVGVRYVGEMGRHLGYPGRSGVLPPEELDELQRLLLRFLLCAEVDRVSDIFFRGLFTDSQ